MTIAAGLAGSKWHEERFYVHKILKLPFAPHVGMELSDLDTDGYYSRLTNALEFAYSIKNDVFYYTDKHEFNSFFHRSAINSF